MLNYLSQMQDETAFYQKLQSRNCSFFSTRFWWHLLTQLSLCYVVIYYIRNYWQFPPYVVMLSECDLCFFFLFSFFVFHIGWTLTTKKQLLKHLKIYFDFSFTHHMSPPCHPLFQLVWEHLFVCVPVCLCVCVHECVCVLYDCVGINTCIIFRLCVSYRQACRPSVLLC